MTEIEISLEDINPNDLLGVNNSHLKIIQGAFPKAKIVSRGSQLKVIGEEQEIADVVQKIGKIIDFLLRLTNLSNSLGLLAYFVLDPFTFIDPNGTSVVSQSI